MTGQQLLIAAIIIVLVIAFIITVVLQNITAKKIISANTKLVENQNTLLEQNKALTEKLQEKERVMKKNILWMMVVCLALPLSASAQRQAPITTFRVPRLISRSLSTTTSTIRRVSTASPPPPLQRARGVITTTR